MASIDKAAIVFSIAIALVGVAVAAVGSSVDNSPAAPTQQMSSSANTDAAEAKAAADAAAEARAEAAAEARAEAAAEARAAEAKAAADAKAAAIQAEAAAIQAEAAVAASAGPQTHIVETAMGSGAPGCETSNACYLPQDITINTGDTVKWDNVDTAAHTVTGGSPADGPSGVFDSSLLMAGLDYSFTFDDAGNYDYFCMVHPWMVGSVTVN
ncbi:plastocyanin/azurin family copper-binding protein [Nitrosopumilus sp.]|nr:plastocyanin/azurin family copper-binding protein [Nitrosopumilus sp.]